MIEPCVGTNTTVHNKVVSVKRGSTVLGEQEMTHRLV